MKGFLTLGLVAVCWLGPGARLSSAQGAYFPPPAWNQKLPASTRFVLTLFEEVCANNICAQIAQAVLDRETGLVWERSPRSLATTKPGALYTCATTAHATRAGWRLPSVDELTSLLDLAVTTGLALPPGHPFQNVSELSSYWTGTDSAIPGASFQVAFNTISTNFQLAGQTPNDQELSVWCVRGGAR
jgi:Protein of unknown function (DUF1566)